MVLTRTRKLVYMLLLFAAAVALVLVAGATHEAGPLFAVWIPLLTVPWLLTRPEPGDPPRKVEETEREAAEAGSRETGEPSSAD